MTDWNTQYILVTQTAEMEAAAALHQTKAKSEPLLHVMFVSIYILHICIDLFLSLCIRNKHFIHILDTWSWRIIDPLNCVFPDSQMKT